MSLLTYRLRRIYTRQRAGSTRPVQCGVSGILKFDDPESPHNVYNEIVALRLAQLVGAPVADGCLTATGDGQAYISLEVGSPGLPLPEVAVCRRDRVAERYPAEAANLLAFDVFIGNWDRGQNLRASLVTPHISMFAGYDHSHALLNVETDPWQSIQRLQSEDTILRFHPFLGRVRGDLFDNAISRIGRVSDDLVRGCCQFERPFRGVSLELQSALADSMCWRKAALRDITESDDATELGIP